MTGYEHVKFNNFHLVTQNLRDSKEKYNEELRKKLEAPEDNTASPKSKKQKSGKGEVEQKIRLTKKVNQDLKKKLGSVLDRMAEIESEKEEQTVLLGQLIQTLWDSFMSKNPKAYVKLSSFDRDVDEKDIVWLIQNHIAERNPKNPDEIRMLDFTQ